MLLIWETEFVGRLVGRLWEIICCLEGQRWTNTNGNMGRQKNEMNFLERTHQFSRLVANRIWLAILVIPCSHPGTARLVPSKWLGYYSEFPYSWFFLSNPPAFLEKAFFYYLMVLCFKSVQVSPESSYFFFFSIQYHLQPIVFLSKGCALYEVGSSKLATCVYLLSNSLSTFSDG